MRMTFVYGCPACGCMVKRMPWDAEDPGGIKYYSDQHPDADLHPNYPGLIACRDCGEVFIMSKRHLLGSVGELRGDVGWEELCKMPFGGSLGDGGVYLRSLELCTTDNQRAMLRLGAWWAFNREYLATGDMGVYRREDYIDNCRVLAERFKESLRWSDVALAIEMYRNIGEFDRCEGMLSCFRKSPLSKQLMAASKGRRIETFELKP